MTQSQGVLLLNLGTPEAPTPQKVKDYLAEFLMDPFVIDIPGPLRWLLLHGVILRTRPARSAEAYRQIWTERGSPQLFHLHDLVQRMQSELDGKAPGRWRVLAGMRYGSPSVEAALKRFAEEGIRDVLVCPLYPQYALATTESSIVAARTAAARVSQDLSLKFLPPFYEAPGFLDAFASVAREELEGYAYDHVLFSFHGLPERQVKRTDRSGGESRTRHCLVDRSCCDRIGEANRDCYRAHCFASARGIAQKLGLSSTQYSVCFQSRLGRAQWIKPYTDKLYGELPLRGLKRIAVICPSFVADCLETLEEIRIRGKEQFIEAGGEDLRLISSLNSSPRWVSALAELVTQSV